MMLKALVGSRGHAVQQGMNEYVFGEPSVRICVHFHEGDGHCGSDASHFTGTLNQKSERRN